MKITGKHILSTKQFDSAILKELFVLADFLTPVARGMKTTRILEGAVLANLFFEPSTRTRVSFDSAFLRLGGAVSHTTGFHFSSIAKGESLYDTSRVISGYSDVIVIRHPTDGAVSEFASATNVPVINGGCGSEEHPTQSLLDLYTLQNELNRVGKSFSNLTIAFIGDLKYGRTVHSLVHLLALTKGIHYVFVSPKGLQLPQGLRFFVDKTAGSVREYSSMADVSTKIDVVYGTRIQRERMTAEDALQGGGNFRVTKAFIDSIGAQCIMHPLPRDSRDVDFDLSNELDHDSRLAIFRQSDSGIQVRMALFCMVMGVEHAVLNSLSDAKWWRPDYIGPDDAEFYAIKRGT